MMPEFSPCGQQALKSNYWPIPMYACMQLLHTPMSKHGDSGPFLNFLPKDIPAQQSAQQKHHAESSRATVLGISY
jgi:hypothetical protein